MLFTGWVPTITGRMSFSRVGGDYGNHRATVCNRSRGANGFIFGVERRVSRDSPLPGILMRAFGRISDSRVFAYLSVGAAELPVPNSDDAVSPHWKDDAHGELVGTVIVTVSSLLDKPSPAEFARDYRKLARQASEPYATDGEIATHAQAAQTSLTNFWTSLVHGHGTNPHKTPAFARAKVRLKRTGVCEVEVDVEDLYNTASMLDLRAQNLSAAAIAQSPEARAAAAQVARHVFFFMRDLAHRHYHHTPHSDLATTIFPADGDDETWRRETQYGLVRMAISARREHGVISYRQALGIIAYAEAFQHHLAMWKGTANNTTECDQVFPYDFAALKASMEASLGGKEADLGHFRETIIYAVGSFLAVLGAILGSGQIWKADTRFDKCADNYCLIQKSFWNLTTNIVDYPWYWLLASLALGTFILVAARRLFAGAQLIQSLRSGVSRLADGIMGSLAQILKFHWIGWLITWLLMAACIYVSVHLFSVFSNKAFELFSEIIARSYPHGAFLRY